MNVRLLCGVCSRKVRLKDIKKIGKSGVIIIHECSMCKTEIEEIGILKGMEIVDKHESNGGYEDEI